MTPAERSGERTASYAEGDCFGVPLSSGRRAICVVTRIAPGARVAFGYFFWSAGGALDERELASLRASDAVLAARFGDLGIIDGSWTPIGRIPAYDRRRWPMPDFRRRDGLGGKWLRVRYQGENPNSRPIETPISDKDAARLPKGSLYGAGAIELLLDSLLKQPMATDSLQIPVPRREHLGATDRVSEYGRLHLVDHHLYFRSKRDAGAAAREAAGLGFIPEIGEINGQWSVTARKSTPLAQERVDDDSGQLEAIARTHGGRYDGLERSIATTPATERQRPS